MKRHRKTASTVQPVNNLASSSSPETTKGGSLQPPDLSSPPTLLVGIDWADAKHAYLMQDPQERLHRGEVEQSPDALTKLLDQWRQLYPSSVIVICLETSRGPLINALLEHPDVRIYPVNPNALANYRRAFAHGGGKSDPVDAALILQYLKHYRDQLRPLRIDGDQTRELATLCLDRRAFVESRVKLAQQLQALLKGYFPAVLKMKPTQIYANFVIGLLTKYATLADVQKAGRVAIRKLFYGMGTKERIEQRLDALMTAVPLTTDPVTLRTSARKVQTICRQLAELNSAIRGYDDQIEKLVVQHADYSLFVALPCGDNSRARLIAALGDDRSRYANADDMAAASGIAPMTTQSGKQRYVSSRWACTKFMRQTFHEFAGLSILKSRWARAHYDAQIAKGKTAQMAKRSLAFKWIRIIYSCWRDGTPYDEARYVRRLAESKSPLAQKLTSSSAT